MKNLTCKRKKLEEENALLYFSRLFVLFLSFSLSVRVSPPLSLLIIQIPNSLLTTLEDQPPFFRKEERGPEEGGEDKEREVEREEGEGEEEGESSARHWTAMVPLAGTAAATSPPTRSGADGREEEEEEEEAEELESELPISSE